MTASTGIVLNGNTISVDFSTYTYTSSLTILLNAKQDDLTTSEGIYIILYIIQSSSGVGHLTTTVTGYKLRYQTTGLSQSTPSGDVQTLIFKDFTVSEIINLASEYQLETALPSAQPISYITNLQAEVNKLSNVVVGTSGLSLGTGTGATIRFAVYEASNSYYFYGLASFEGSNNGYGVGLGLYGGTNALGPDQYGNTASAKLPHMLITRDGGVGINQSNPQQVLDLTGNINCDGSCVITGTCTASSFPTISDQSIKDNTLRAEYQEIHNLFNSVYVKTYTRHDGA